MNLFSKHQTLYENEVEYWCKWKCNKKNFNEMFQWAGFNLDRLNINIQIYTITTTITTPKTTCLKMNDSFSWNCMDCGSWIVATGSVSKLGIKLNVQDSAFIMWQMIRKKQAVIYFGFNGMSMIKHNIISLNNNHWS